MKRRSNYSRNPEAERRRRFSRHGSILMEAVISMPLLMVIIGATLWLGDLTRGRSRSLATDRYAAWNRGNRLGGANVSETAIWEEFYERNPDQHVKKVDLKVKDSGWYREVYGQVHTQFKMPQWTEGMVHAGTSWEADPVTKSWTITGRDDPHLIVMRGGEREDEKDKINWISEAMSPWWPGFGGGGGGNGPSFAMQKAYERYPAFVRWSE